MSDSTESYWDGLPPLARQPGEFDELLRSGVLQPPPRPGVVGLIGRFEVLRQIGKGSMGLVMLARDSANEDLLAIKLLHPRLAATGTAVKLFRRDATHLMQLNHPNILPVLELSPPPQHPYYTMPYVPGGSLSERIRREQPMDDEVVVSISLQVAQALHMAHDCGIVHRDIKPGNILVGGNDQVLLADFGAAYQLDNDSILDARRPSWVGTAPFMSPIVAAGKTEDGRCDIYALGAVMYTMLTGSPPYQGHDLSEVVRQVLAGPPPDIAEARPDVPADLAQVVRWCMAREQRDRYANITDTVEDLLRVRQDENPIGPSQSVRKRSSFVTSISIFLPIVVALSLVISGLMGSASSTDKSGSATSPKTARTDLPSVNSRPVRGTAGKKAVGTVKLSKAVMYLFRQNRKAYYAQTGVLDRGMADLQVPDSPSPGDRFDCSIELAEPAYCQALIVNANGTCQYYQLQEQLDAKGEHLGTTFRLPNDPLKNYYMDCGLGAQAVFIVLSRLPISEKELVPNRELLAGWQSMNLKRFWRLEGTSWRSPDKIRTEGRGAAPPSPLLGMSQFCQRLGQRCHGIAFPVE